MTRKDFRRLLEKLVKQGFDVRETSKNHYLIRKDGRRVATRAGTPSDHRSVRNFLADLRRAGFQP